MVIKVVLTDVFKSSIWCRMHYLFYISKKIFIAIGFFLQGMQGLRGRPGSAGDVGPVVSFYRL